MEGGIMETITIRRGAWGERIVEGDYWGVGGGNFEDWDQDNWGKGNEGEDKYR